MYQDQIMNQDKNMYQDENKYKIKCWCAKCASVGECKCASVHEQQVCACVNSVQVWEGASVQLCKCARVQV